MLLDEVEKAHPDVFNVLLQVLDDGRLTDGQGRTVDFRNTVIIMTSNLGSDRIRELPDDSDYGTMKSTVLELVSSYFRPEFLNRIDDLVVFHTLKRSQLNAIAGIQVNRLKQRLAEQDIVITISDKAKETLANIGFDPVYGARPLKRAVQTHLETPLAKELLAGKFHAADTISVDAEDGVLTFSAG